MTNLSYFRFAVRMLFRYPRVTFFAVVAMTIGIAVTATMFSIAYGGILRGLPFEDSHMIMHLGTSNLERGQSNLDVSLHDFLDWREQQQSFEDLAGFYTNTVNLSGGERPERYSGAFVTAETFDLLRIKPLSGRTFLKGEDTAQSKPVALLGYKIWQNRYGGDLDILGKVIRVNGESTTVVGVAQRDFEFPIKQDLWLPLKLNPLDMKRGEQRLEVFGRLKAGVELTKAKADLSAIARRLELTYPETNKGIGVVIRPFPEWFLGEDDEPVLYIMLVTALFVLLIACTNVSHLLLARAMVRTKELAMRSVLGASRGALLSQLLIDGFVLSLLGAFFGLILAYWGVELFNKDVLPAMAPPFWVRIAIDRYVFILVATLIMICSLAAGLGPAIQASRIDLNKVLKNEQPAASSLRTGLFSKGVMILGIAFSCVLLTAAGMTVRSLLNLQAVDLGFETENIFTARISLPEADYPQSVDTLAFYQGLLADLEAHPDIVSVAMTSHFPTEGSRRQYFAMEGQSYPSDESYPWAWSLLSTPDFFELLHVPILQGRDFDIRDTEDGQPVAIVNQSLARWLWPGESPVGKRIRLGRGERWRQPWRTIVGVVADIQIGNLDDNRLIGFYLPFAQNPRQLMGVAIQGRGDSSILRSVLKESVLSIDPDLPIYQARSMAEVVAEKIYGYRVISILFSLFGLLAFILAAVGTYGVMSFSISQRTMEFGLRIAMGACGNDILRLIVWDGARQLFLGLLAGIPLSLLVSSLLTVFLFGVGPADPATMAGVILLLSVLGLGASLMAARRVSVLDPMTALRSL